VKVGHHPVTVEEDDDLLARESFSILVVLILGSVILFSMLGIGRRHSRFSRQWNFFVQYSGKFAQLQRNFSSQPLSFMWNITLFLCSVWEKGLLLSFTMKAKIRESSYFFANNLIINH
jgi:hypothetical protein